jgi:hypothetical protein
VVFVSKKGSIGCFLPQGVQLGILPNCTPYGRKCPIVPLVEENTLFYLLWKKYPIVPLVEENTQFHLLWKKYPLVPLVEENTQFYP